MSMMAAEAVSSRKLESAREPDAATDRPKADLAVISANLSFILFLAWKSWLLCTLHTTTI